MPYGIRYVAKDERPWKIYKKKTGKVVGSSKTRSNAVASIRARRIGSGE